MMKLFKPYTNIKDFLHRFTLLKIGRLHIRLHKLTSEDRSTLFHNHPFHYISFILKGGYTERVRDGDREYTKSHSRGSLIFRNRKVFHRIEELKGDTITLFIAYGKYTWNAINTNPDISTDGIFQREIHGKTVWSKRKDGVWFIGNLEKEIAEKETRHSIHQV